MKRTILFSALITVISFSVAAQSSKSLLFTYAPDINTEFTKARDIQEILNRYTSEGIPGVSIAVHTEKEGWWAGAAGFSNLETRKAMDIRHLQYTQSVSKTYMAVAILQLKERGKLQLNDPITKYLPTKYANYIHRSKELTIRMLLNQTSGVPEYSTNPALVSYVIQHPVTYFSADDCLRSIQKEKLQFEPGTKYAYSNTNYLLLSLIADAITGDHAAYIRKNIFIPLGLQNSFYENNHTYLKKLPLTDSYWDVLGVGRPANITNMQQVNVSSLKGDDGIVCTPLDAVRFFKGLMEGKLLSEGSLKEMLSFVKDEKGKDKYGMGIFYFDLGGVPAYGHGGGGIGAGCILLYIPAMKTYLFLSTNLGVLVESELTKKVEGLRNDLFAAILQ